MTLTKLTEFFGREHDFVLHTKMENAPEIKTYRFPSVESNCILGEYAVLITLGMSQKDLPNNPESKRIEMSLLLRPQYKGEPEADIAGSILNWTANYSFSKDTFIEQGQIFNWGNPFINDCQLSNLYFSFFPLGEDLQTEYETLKELLKVDDVLNLIPISEKEANYADKRGLKTFLEMIEKKDLSPDFNFFRKSLV